MDIPRAVFPGARRRRAEAATFVLRDDHGHWHTKPLTGSPSNPDPVLLEHHERVLELDAVLYDRRDRDLSFVGWTEPVQSK